ncbi:MAG: hypothetical protein ACI93B_002296 [Yoonia sp.]|jgi:hypothetical protein
MRGLELLHLHEYYYILISKVKKEIIMAKSERPKANTKPVLVRFPSDKLKQIDEARRLVDDLPTRPEMIRRMVEDWLQRHDSQ